MPKQSNGSTVVAAENKGPEQTTRQEPEQKYSVERLRLYCVKLFGVTMSTFDGAMYGHEAEMLTVNEADQIIKKWLKGGK